MKILFMGRKKYAADMLLWTIERGHEVVGVITDSHFPNSPTMILAQKNKIPLLSLDEATQIILENPAYTDLIVSYLYWKKIKEPLISTPKFGCINFHPAILPDWKGTAGYNIAILNKLSEWGASAHFCDENIDTGSIIRVFKFNFDYRNETAQTLEKKTQLIQCDLYKSILTDIAEGTDIKDKCIPNIGGTYISKSEMEKMKEVNLQTDDISLKCRAFWFPPYMGATIYLNGKPYTLIDEYILQQLKEPDQTSI